MGPSENGLSHGVGHMAVKTVLAQPTTLLTPACVLSWRGSEQFTPRPLQVTGIDHSVPGSKVHALTQDELRSWYFWWNMAREEADVVPRSAVSSTCRGRNWEKQTSAHCRRDEAIIHSGCHMDLHPTLPAFSVRESSWLVLLELWAAMDVKRLWTGDFNGRNFLQFWKLETWNGVQPGQVLVRGLFLACRQLSSYCVLNRGQRDRDIQRERETGRQRHRDTERDREQPLWCLF